MILFNPNFLFFKIQITTEDVKGEPHPRHHGDLRVLVKMNLHIEVAKNIIQIIDEVIKNTEIVTQHTEMTAQMTGADQRVMTGLIIGGVTHGMTPAGQTGGLTGAVVMNAPVAVQADTIQTAVTYH